MLLELERKRRAQTEAQIQHLMEMDRTRNDNDDALEENSILELHRQLLSLKLKVDPKNPFLTLPLVT